jgi:hypothetical protein
VLVAALACTLSVACMEDYDFGADGGPSASSQQKDAAAAAGEATTTMIEALALANAMFRLHGELDPHAAVADVTRTIEDEVAASDAACATTSPVDAAEAIAGFRAVFAPGCTLRPRRFGSRSISARSRSKVGTSRAPRASRRPMDSRSQ